MPDSSRWYEIANVAEIPSPALLVYLDRVDDNIRDMVAVAGSVDRLRPQQGLRGVERLGRVAFRPEQAFNRVSHPVVVFHDQNLAFLIRHPRARATKEACTTTAPRDRARTRRLL